MERVITGKLKAIVSQYANLNKDGMPEDVADLTFIRESSADYFMSDGYTVIGDAEVTVTIIDKSEIIKSKVESLKAEAKKIRAEATMKELRIGQQIRDLLAISFDDPKGK